MDNPRLNVREWEGRNPIRVVTDRNLQLDRGLHLFDGSQATIIYNEKQSEITENLEFVRLNTNDDLGAILDNLAEHRIGSVIVEGGRKLLNGFIQQNLWDEARIFRSEETFQEGIAAPGLQGYSAFQEMDVLGDQLTITYRQLEQFNVYESTS